MNTLCYLLNRVSGSLLALDPDSLGRFASLEGRVLCTRLTAPEHIFYVFPTVLGLKFSDQHEGDIDVTLCGTLADFVRLGLGVAGGRTSSRAHISLVGDVDTAQSFQKILVQMDVDWEELLARCVGDTPARKTGNLLRALGSHAAESVRLSRENLADYLQEEKKILVSDVAMQRFQRRVEQLRANTDRIEKRIRKIAEAMDKAGAG